MFFIAVELWRAFLFKWRVGGQGLNQVAFRSPNGFQVFSRLFYKTKRHRWIKKNSSTYGRKIGSKAWGLVKERNQEQSSRTEVCALMRANEAPTEHEAERWSHAQPLETECMMQALYLVNTLFQEIQSSSTYIKSCPYSIRQLIFLHTPSLSVRITKDLSSLYP